MDATLFSVMVRGISISTIFEKIQLTNCYSSEMLYLERNKFIEYFIANRKLQECIKTRFRSILVTGYHLSIDYILFVYSRQVINDRKVVIFISVNSVRWNYSNEFIWTMLCIVYSKSDDYKQYLESSHIIGKWQTVSERMRWNTLK